LGGTKIEGLALDVEGREVFRKRIPTPRGDYGATISSVQSLVREIGEGSVGIGIPGAESRATGLEATHEGKTVELVICFECLSMSGWTDGVQFSKLTARGPEETFNRVLKEKGVKLPPGREE
jgi:hypothetical protein